MLLHKRFQPFYIFTLKIAPLKKPHYMKSRIKYAFAALLIAAALIGCSDTSNSSDLSSTSSNTVSDNLSADDIISHSADTNMTEKAYFSDETFRSNVKKLYGIDYDKLEDGAIAYGNNGTADEISIFKLKDGLSAEKVFNERIEQRKTQFENYKPEELPKIDAAQIFEKNGFWILVISKESDSIKKNIEEMF